MTPIDWYFARGNKQTGPVSSAELKRLAASGEIRPDDLVWREGLTEWALARSVRGLFENEDQPAGAASEPVVALPGDAEPTARPEEAIATPSAVATRAGTRHVVDVLLNSLRSDAAARGVETTARVFRACGLYGLLVAMAVVAAFALIMAAKFDMLDNLLWGLGLIVLLGALQYVAGKSCDALERLGRTTGGTLVSTLLPDCFAALSLAAGLGMLFASASAAVEGSTWLPLLTGIAGAIVCGYAALAVLNPSTLSISIVSEEVRAGEEAIGSLMFLAKVLLRVVPVALGTGVIAGTLLMGYACYVALNADAMLVGPHFAASTARTVLVFSAALPLVVYALFLLYALLLDLCRAILGLPERAGEGAEEEANETELPDRQA